MSTRTPGMGFIFAVTFLDIAGMGLAIPVAPALVASFMGNDLSAAALYVGLTASLYTAVQFACAPFLGALSDQHGRKPVLLGALLISAIAFFGSALAPTLGFLLATRALAGLGGASLSVAQTYIADVSPPEDRAKNYGMVGAAFGLGFIIGPALGGWLGGYDLRLPFLAAGLVSLLNLAYGLLFMTESHKPENRRAFRWSEANPLGWIVVLQRHAGVRRFAYSLIWVWFAQQALYTTWVLYTSLRYGWTPSQNGMSLAVVGISSVVVQGFLVGKLVPLLGERTAVVGGLIWSAVGFAAYGAAPAGWMIYPLIAVASIGGISGPTLQGLVSRQVGPDEQGAVQGAMTSLTSLTGIAGPLAANAVFAWGTGPGMNPPIPGAAFFMGAACLLVGAVLAIPLVPKKDQPANKVLVDS